jgi:hypothetical protein
MHVGAAPAPSLDWVSVWEGGSYRPPQAKTYGNGRSEMRVLLSTYRAGVWL